MTPRQGRAEDGKQKKNSSFFDKTANLQKQRKITVMTKDGTGAGTSQNEDPTKQLIHIKPESTTTRPTDMTTVATHINTEVGVERPQLTEVKIHRGHKTPLATHMAS